MKSLPNRNYKKYRVRVLSLFKSFLSSEINKSQLINNLSDIENELKNNTKTLKGLWFKFFKGDTGATTIQDLYYGLENPTNDKHFRECLSLSIEDSKGLKIHFT